MGFGTGDSGLFDDLTKTQGQLTMILGLKNVSNLSSLDFEIFKAPIPHSTIFQMLSICELLCLPSTEYLLRSTGAILNFGHQFSQGATANS